MPSPSADIWMLLFKPYCWIFTGMRPLWYNCMPEESVLIKTDKPNRSEAAHWSFITVVIPTSDLRDVGNAICCYFHSHLRNFSDNYLWAQRLSLRSRSAVQKLVVSSFSYLLQPAILSTLTSHPSLKGPPSSCYLVIVFSICRIQWVYCPVCQMAQNNRFKLSEQTYEYLHTKSCLSKIPCNVFVKSIFLNYCPSQIHTILIANYFRLIFANHR